MVKRKQKTIAKLVDDAAVLLQYYVRLKAAGENGYCACVTCGKTYHYKNMDGGHFVPARVTATKILEENIHPQCKYCNGFDKENAHNKYTLYMIDMYGREFTDELLATKSTTKKYTREEVAEITKDLKQKIKELE